MGKTCCMTMQMPYICLQFSTHRELEPRRIDWCKPQIYKNQITPDELSPHFKCTLKFGKYVHSFIVKLVIGEEGSKHLSLPNLVSSFETIRTP